MVSNDKEEAMAVIELEQVNKTYSGKNGTVQALKEVSLSVEEGEIFGFIGPNGAGKTTCFYCVIGLVTPDYGDVHLGGEDITNISFYKTSNEIFATKRSCNHKLTGKNMRKELLEDYLKSYDCKFYKKCININF